MFCHSHGCEFTTDTSSSKGRNRQGELRGLGGRLREA